MTTVLIVDDNREVRRATQAVLKYGGYTVMEAADGTVGLEMARKCQPDIILSDVVMPSMDGYDLIDALQNDPATTTIPVIFLTALSEDQAMRQGMTLGADDFIVKPAQPQELLDRIETRLRKQSRLTEKHDTSMRMLRKNIIYALPHEMRTPLQLILGYGDILESSDEITDPEEIKEYGATIKRAGRRLERIIENYLVYAQLEVIAGDAEEEEKLRNHLVGKVHETIEKLVRLQAASTGRQDDLECDLAPIALRISKANLEKIITELVDNALKFSDAGTPIRIDGQRADDGYLIVIEDKGRGMDESQIPRIGAYMQFERALYEQQGLGLGMTIAKRLVEMHGGQMRIESQKEQGTRIRISFPL